MSPKGITGSTAMKQIGKQWKTMSKEEQDVYQTQADQWNALPIEEQTNILDGEKQVRADKKKQKQTVKKVEVDEKTEAWAEEANVDGEEEGTDGEEEM